MAQHIAAHIPDPGQQLAVGLDSEAVYVAGVGSVVADMPALPEPAADFGMRRMLPLIFDNSCKQQKTGG